MKKYVVMNPILPAHKCYQKLPASERQRGGGREEGDGPVRTKYKNVRRRLYPRYRTFEANPPSDNFVVQYIRAWRKIYTEDAPLDKNALHHLPANQPQSHGLHTNGNSQNRGRSKSIK
jgi:hypothetical protein